MPFNFLYKKHNAKMFLEAFPIELKEDVKTVVRKIPVETYINVSEQKISYVLNGETIYTPYRVYFKEIPDEKLGDFTHKQLNILHCIYSRSCDGHIREKHINALLHNKYPYWSIPFIVKLSDEYVIQILECIYSILQYQDTTSIKRFCMENMQVFCKSHSRMISYWNEYYRYRCFYYKDYIGEKLYKECFGYSRSMERTK